MVFQSALHVFYQTPSFSKRYNNFVVSSQLTLSLCVIMLNFPELSVSLMRKHHLTRYPEYPTYINDNVIRKEKLNARSESIHKKQHEIYSPYWISKNILKSSSQHNTQLNLAFDSSRDSVSNPPSKLTPCPFGRESSEGRPPKDPLTLCPDR